MDSSTKLLKELLGYKNQPRGVAFCNDGAMSYSLEAGLMIQVLPATRDLATLCTPHLSLKYV